MHSVPLVGVGKERYTLIGPWGYLSRQAPITRACLSTTGPVPADERHWYVTMGHYIADPRAIDMLMDAIAESGNEREEPVSKHQIQSWCGE